jgi:serine/threonine-protein kinase CHEK1
MLGGQRSTHDSYHCHTNGVHSIKKAVPLEPPFTVFAVKFIHKDYAIRKGRVAPKQLALEISLHQHVGSHDNIIRFYQAGEDPTWRWIAMELAEGGDLFDKIESDEGVGEDVAHFYFTQLISAVSYMHSKGIGHRDMKPENILLSADGDLKIADFGLATLFEYKGQTKMCTTMCGSPPYIAPEVISCSSDKKKGRIGPGYRGNLADIWSCGVVLFVLLVGNTPWDQPTEESYEYSEYVASDGQPKGDELWDRLPPETASLLRGMMRIDTNTRFSLKDIRQHPWFNRPNAYHSNGRLENPIGLATTMFESLHIDFEKDPLASQTRQNPTPPEDSMDIDSPKSSNRSRIAATPPGDPAEELAFEYERSLTLTQNASQAGQSSQALLESTLSEEPTMSQFTSTPSVPLSRTQLARRFRDIVPAYSLTKFYSAWELNSVFPLIVHALEKLDVPCHPQRESQSSGKPSWIRVRLVDERLEVMKGDITVEDIGGFVDVSFVKMNGDPVQWRRFFKKVTVLCKEAVYRPDE